MHSISRRGLLAMAGGVAIAGGAAARAAPRATADTWLNEPRQWRREGGSLFLTAHSKTDFWRKTYFGYVTDNGHLLHRPVRGDFTADVKVGGAFADQYDQAGLMVRLDHSCWMKCGVEYIDKVLNVSAVITRDFSDWSGVALREALPTLWLRLVRKGSAFTFSFSPDGKAYREVRQGFLTEAPEIAVGLMAAAPEGKGFEARLDDFRIY